MLKGTFRVQNSATQSAPGRRHAARPALARFSRWLSQFLDWLTHKDTMATQSGFFRSFLSFLSTRHAPTLDAAFLFFSFSCCIWVLNGATSPFISETFNLSPAQKGLMLSIPIFAGALMGFPLGLLSQYIGRKNATLVEMG